MPKYRTSRLLLASLGLSLVFNPVLVTNVAIGKDVPAVKVSGKDAVKGASSVAIGAFNVGFIFESTDQIKKTGGILAAVGGVTKAKSSLVGVTPEMMQQIADAAYADLVQQLIANGFVVAEPAAVFASDALATKGKAEPAEATILLEKKSKGKATYMYPTVIPRQILIAGDVPTSGGLGQIGNNMTYAQNGVALGAYARSSGMPVITATYLIDFSDQQRPGAFDFGGLKVNANLSVTSGYSKMTVLGANGKQTVLTLGQSVSVDGEFIDIADASSGGEKGTQAAANVAGGLAAAAGLGGLGFGKTRKYEFNAKPGTYEEGATKAASLANQLLVTQLTDLR
jgi:hypothetical protein